MTPKPRNPLVALAKFRRAGRHEKTEKAQRRGEKMDLQRQLRGNVSKTDPGVVHRACR